MGALRGLHKLVDVTPEGVDPFQLVMEVGKVTYSTTDSEAAYRTNIAHVVAGTVNITGAISSVSEGNTDDTVSVPLGAVTSNSLTLTRSSSATSAGVYSVVLYGYKYITDGAS